MLVQELQLLGISKTEEFVTAKKTARKLISRSHPDVGGNGENFVKLVKAWESVENAYKTGKLPAKVAKIVHNTLFTYRKA